MSRTTLSLTSRTRNRNDVLSLLVAISAGHRGAALLPAGQAAPWLTQSASGRAGGRARRMETVMPDWPLIGALAEAKPQIHPEAWVAPGAVVIGEVTLGRAASVWYGTVLRADEAEIVVGAECNIQDLCCVHVDPDEPAVLEDQVSLGHRAVVHGAYVEAGALIGVGAIVLGRARIGAGSLIAAGAVITPGSTVPAGVLVAGVPGRVIRELTEADRAGFSDTASGYVARSARHRQATWYAPTQQA